MLPKEVRRQKTKRSLEAQEMQEAKPKTITETLRQKLPELVDV